MACTCMVRLAAVAVMAALPSAALGQLYGTSGGQNGGGDAGALYRFDADTGTYVPGSGIEVVIPGVGVGGVTGLAIDPTSDVAYAVVFDVVGNDWLLATLDLATGAGLEIGSLGDEFAAITFRANGQLYGVTSDDAVVRETLYRISKLDASKVLATGLGNGDGGEALAYDSLSDNFYHWSGDNQVVYERIQPDPPYGITSIPISGSPSGETVGAAWDGCFDQFIGSSVNATFNNWLRSGLVTAPFGTNPDAIRGLALVGGNGCNVDLGIALDAVPSAPVPGATVTLTVMVANDGPARAIAPRVTFTLPANITSIVAPGCGVGMNGLLGCDLPKLYRGDTASRSISGTYTGGVGTVSATITSASDETASGDNVAAIRVGDPFFADGFE